MAPDIPQKYGYREEVLKTLVELLKDFEDVSRGNMFGFPSFRASGQTFSCVYQRGISLKLPEAAAEATLQAPGISPFVPFGRARMRQWIYIERENARALREDFPLIQASILYVRSLGGGAARPAPAAARTVEKPQAPPAKPEEKPAAKAGARPAAKAAPKAAPKPAPGAPNLVRAGSKKKAGAAKKPAVSKKQPAPKTGKAKKTVAKQKAKPARGAASKRAAKKSPASRSGRKSPASRKRR